MSKTKVKANLRGNMAFEMNLNGHKLVTDASEEIGGQNLGPRPKQLLLAGLIGCTGIDISMMLEKMRVKPEDFSIEVEAENSDTVPKVYKKIHLTFKFKGKNLPRKKVERAVNLSQEKYCGVSAMLKKAAPITYDIIIED